MAAVADAAAAAALAAQQTAASATPSQSIQANPPKASPTAALATGHHGFKPRTTKGTTLDLSRALYTKADRKKLGGDERIKLITAVMQNQQKRFEFQTLANDDDKQLGTTYSTQTLVNQMRDNFQKFDLVEVFNLVKPVDVEHSADLYSERLNLFNDYHTITLADVTASNTWFHYWTDPDDLMHEDLEWTFRYFFHNVDADLYNKVREAYDQYSPDKQGGPLFLWHLMNTVSTNSEATINSIVSKVRKFSIKDQPGEDILQITSMLRNNIRRIHNARSSLPEDFLREMLEVLQTSSVPDFNSQFQNLYRNHLLQSTIARSDCGTSMNLLTAS
ncbi:MAG: hypothetical protein SGILL_003742, partial [Bacillariaceae sp.]